jgi:alpha-beta hydrolase superfamily lysophospholipase
MPVTGSVPVPAPGSVPAPRPLYLHAPAVGEPVFGVFHEVAGAHTAVLFLPPFGYDDVCAYRGLRMWALTLAAEGVASLRIDLPGAGDSGGGPRDPGRARSWPEAVAAAASWLRAETGARRIVALGLGLGGLVAGQAVVQGADVDDLVLWGAPSRGRTLVRELRAFARLGITDADSFAWDESMPALPEGALESGGFLLSPETVAWLQECDLATAPWPDAQRRHVLLLGREGISVDAKLQRALTGAGVDVTVADGPGYTELMDEPHRSLAPEQSFAIVSEWLAATDGTLPAGSADRAVPEVTATPTTTVTVDGIAVHEAPIAIDAPGHGGSLFGIVATPVATAELAPLTVVFLDVGAERRIGANRMWVEAARRWAAQGVPSVRLDLIGIGEGGGPATPWNGEYALYDDALVEQVAIALDALPGYGLPPRFLLVGMCSGAYWAFTRARQDPRIIALELLNARMLLFDETRGSAAEVRHLRRLTGRELWRDVLAGKLTWARARRMLNAVAIMAARVPRMLAGRLRAKAGGDDPLDLALDTLRDQGTAVSLRFIDGEPLREELERSGHLARLARWPNVSVRPLPGPTHAHTLQVVRMQAGVHRELDAFLAQQLARS